MACVAVWSKFKVYEEIAESLGALGAEAVPYSSESELESLASVRRPDLVLDVNCHRPVKDLCLREGLRYAVWSFDSGIGPLLGKWGFAPSETYFLFNKRDFAVCSGLGARAFYLPFSAAGLFELEPRSSGFVCDVAVVMDSYSVTAGKARSEFGKGMDSALGPSASKALEFAMALIDYAADVQTELLSRDVTSEAVSEIVAKTGVDIFQGRPWGLASVCSIAGQIASSRQRVRLLESLAKAGLKVRLYGDEAWQGLLKGCGGSVELMGWAPYERLPEIYNSARMTVNLTQVQNNDSVPQRVFHALAAGGLLLSNSSEPLLELFRPDGHLAVFETFEEMLSKALLYLEDGAARGSVASAGHAEFLARHRMPGRLSAILESCLPDFHRKQEA